MSEYIVRETGYPGAVKQEIVQELVRCKDCKHSEEALLPHLDLWCNVNGTYCTSDWFCADGKKRGKEDERTD